MFNSLGKKQPINMYRTPLDDFAYRGIQSLEVPFEYAKSFLNPFVSVDELNKKYGIEAQQAALKSAKAKEENYIYKCSQNNNFKESLQVDLKSLNTNIYSTEEIEKLYNECMQKVYNINNSEEAIELANISKNIDYSITFFNQKQVEIIGKNINYYGQISERLDLNMSELRKNIAKKLIETNAVILPESLENEDAKEFLCIAYLQAGEQEQLQDLKVTFDEKENNYYIVNDNTLLSTVTLKYDEKQKFKGASYNSKNTKTDNEIKKLIENSCSIIQSKKQIENISEKDNYDNMINER